MLVGNVLGPHQIQLQDAYSPKLPALGRRLQRVGHACSFPDSAYSVKAQDSSVVNISIAVSRYPQGKMQGGWCS